MTKEQRVNDETMEIDMDYMYDLVANKNVKFDDINLFSSGLVA